MNARRLAGALWIMAGVTCAGLLVFVLIGERIDNLGVLLERPALPTLVLGGAIVALVIGSLLLTRPGPDVVRWSSIAGVAWLIAFGQLLLGAVAAALAGNEFGPVVSSGLITGLGVAGAVVGHRSRAARRPGR